MAHISTHCIDRSAPRCMTRGDAEPCIYDRRVGAGDDEHVNMSLYVDDGKLYCDPTKAAREEADRIQNKLKSRWDVKFQERNQFETFMLSANIRRHSDTGQPGTHTTAGRDAYCACAAARGPAALMREGCCFVGWRLGPLARRLLCRGPPFENSQVKSRLG